MVGRAAASRRAGEGEGVGVGGRPDEAVDGPGAVSGLASLAKSTTFRTAT